MKEFEIARSNFYIKNTRSGVGVDVVRKIAYFMKCDTLTIRSGNGCQGKACGNKAKKGTSEKERNAVFNRYHTRIQLVRKRILHELEQNGTA